RTGIGYDHEVRAATPRARQADTRRAGAVGRTETPSVFFVVRRRTGGERQCVLTAAFPRGRTADDWPMPQGSPIAVPAIRGIDAFRARRRWSRRPRAWPAIRIERLDAD